MGIDHTLYQTFRAVENPTHLKKWPKVTKECEIREKCYVCKGLVKSLTSFLGGTKGWLWYLNGVWCSRDQAELKFMGTYFRLLTIDMLVQGVNEASWMWGIDIGEMFLNFCLHPELWPFAGVDLHPYFQDETRPDLTLWEHWVRCMMGLKSSLYVCIKALLIGNHHDYAHPLHWERVKLNLPGETNDNPFRPKPQEIKNPIGPPHTVSSCLSFLGIQVATKKMRPPSLSPWPWSGLMVIKDHQEVGSEGHTVKMEQHWARKVPI